MSASKGDKGAIITTTELPTHFVYSIPRELRPRPTRTPRRDSGGGNGRRVHSMREETLDTCGIQEIPSSINRHARKSSIVVDLDKPITPISIRNNTQVTKYDISRISGP